VLIARIRKLRRKEEVMEWQELITDGYGRVLQVLEKALDGLTMDDLKGQPHPDCNSMGWLASNHLMLRPCWNTIVL